MLVLTRHRVDPTDSDAFIARVRAALAVLSTRPGWVDGTLGRAVDDPVLWVLATRWRDVGSYRRALSSYDVKVGAVPLLSSAVDEPSAYEVLIGPGADGTSSRAADAGTTGPGQGR